MIYLKLAMTHYSISLWAIDKQEEQTQQDNKLQQPFKNLSL